MQKSKSVQSKILFPKMLRYYTYSIHSTSIAGYLVSSVAYKRIEVISKSSTKVD